MSDEKKRGVWFGPDLQKLVDERSDREGGMRSASGVINAVADRYLAIIRRSTPTLSTGEWCLIFDALNGVWDQDNAALYVGALAHGIHDHIDLNQADKKWDVDRAALMQKLGAYSFCQLTAIVDAAERFWVAPDRPGDNWRPSIAAIVGEGALSD